VFTKEEMMGSVDYRCKDKKLKLLIAKALSSDRAYY
jgi:hypothetical protein